MLLGVVQGGTPNDSGLDTYPLYRGKSLELVGQNPGVELVVWPETISPAPVIEDDLETYLRNYVRTDRREGDESQVLDVPLLLGVNIFRAASPPIAAQKASAQPSSLTNSMVLLDGGGKVAGRYDKQALMPIGEAPIAVGPWEIVAPVTRYQGGKPRQPLQLAGHRLATVICYEDMLPSYVRRLVHDTEAELLVSASSDGWFEGEHPRRLHFVLAALRAVETRRYLLRATRDGMSGLVTPTGRIAWSLPNHVTASGVVLARWLGEKTPYVRLGDWPMLLLSALTIGVSVGFSHSCARKHSAKMCAQQHQH